MSSNFFGVIDSETLTRECLIEIRGVYDGWSVRKLADGTLINRWPEDDSRYAPTQKWIDTFNKQEAEARASDD